MIILNSYYCHCDHELVKWVKMSMSLVNPIHDAVADMNLVIFLQNKSDIGRNVCVGSIFVLQTINMASLKTIAYQVGGSPK